MERNFYGYHGMPMHYPMGNQCCPPQQFVHQYPVYQHHGHHHYDTQVQVQNQSITPYHVTQYGHHPHHKHHHKKKYYK